MKETAAIVRDLVLMIVGASLVGVHFGSFPLGLGVFLVALALWK